MKKNMTRPLAFLLAALIGVLSGCGGTSTPASSPDASNTSSTSADASGSEKTTPNGSDVSSVAESTSGSAPVSGSSGMNSVNTSSNQSTIKNPGTSSPGGKVDPEKYRGTTVRYATWKDPYQDEDGPVITKFQKKYGITVKIDRIGQSDYIQTLTAMINARQPARM